MSTFPTFPSVGLWHADQGEADQQPASFRKLAPRSSASPWPELLHTMVSSGARGRLVLQRIQRHEPQDLPAEVGPVNVGFLEDSSGSVYSDFLVGGQGEV